MSLFLCLSGISLRLSCQKLLPKMRGSKDRQKGENGAYIEWIVYAIGVKPSEHYECIFMYIMEHMNDDC